MNSNVSPSKKFFVQGLSHKIFTEFHFYINKTVLGQQSRVRAEWHMQKPCHHYCSQGEDKYPLPACNYDFHRHVFWTVSFLLSPFRIVYVLIVQRHLCTFKYLFQGCALCHTLNCFLYLLSTKYNSTIISLASTGRAYISLNVTSLLKIGMTTYSEDENKNKSNF